VAEGRLFKPTSGRCTFPFDTHLTCKCTVAKARGKVRSSIVSICSSSLRKLKQLTLPFGNKNDDSLHIREPQDHLVFAYTAAVLHDGQSLSSMNSSHMARFLTHRLKPSSTVPSTSSLQTKWMRKVYNHEVAVLTDRLASSFLVIFADESPNTKGKPLFQIWVKAIDCGGSHTRAVTFQALLSCRLISGSCDGDSAATEIDSVVTEVFKLDKVTVH
jgi:hypothetical protein